MFEAFSTTPSQTIVEAGFLTCAHLMRVLQASSHFQASVGVAACEHEQSSLLTGLLIQWNQISPVRLLSFLLSSLVGRFPSFLGFLKCSLRSLAIELFGDLCRIVVRSLILRTAVLMLVWPAHEANISARATRRPHTFSEFANHCQNRYLQQGDNLGRQMPTLVWFYCRLAVVPERTVECSTSLTSIYR